MVFRLADEAIKTTHIILCTHIRTCENKTVQSFQDLQDSRPPLSRHTLECCPSPSLCSSGPLPPDIGEWEGLITRTHPHAHTHARTHTPALFTNVGTEQYVFISTCSCSAAICTVHAATTNTLWLMANSRSSNSGRSSGRKMRTSPQQAGTTGTHKMPIGSSEQHTHACTLEHSVEALAGVRR